MQQNTASADLMSVHFLPAFEVRLLRLNNAVSTMPRSLNLNLSGKLRCPLIAGP